MTATTQARDSFWLRIIYIVSAVVCGAVAFLTLAPRPQAGMVDVSVLPTVNASLNSLTTVLLVGGWWLVKNKRIAAHKTVMLAAFASSSAHSPRITAARTRLAALSASSCRSSPLWRPPAIQTRGWLKLASLDWELLPDSLTKQFGILWLLN